MKNKKIIVLLILIFEVILFSCLCKVEAANITHYLQIDTNINNASFGTSGIHIEGWKLATEANTKLQVYLDNTKVDDKYITYSRKYALTSIVKGYGTDKENPKPNYDINIPTTNLSNKVYKLQIRFIRSNGEVLKKVESNITIDKRIKHILQIDTNLDNAKFNKSGIHIEGWKLAVEPNTKLEVYLNSEKVDDKYIKYKYKYDLISIVKGYGTYKENPTPNYEIDIPTTDLANKTYKLQIRFLRSNGEVLEQVEKNIIIDKTIKSLLQVDTKLNNVTFKDSTIHIEGWKLAEVSNTKINMYLDNTKMSNNYISYSRKYALTSIVKGYGTDKENPKPHYDIYLPNGILKAGTHTLKLELVTSSGEVLQKAEYKIGTSSKFFQIHIESIYDRNTITKDVHPLSGWVMTNGKKQVLRLMIDGKYQNNTFTRSNRQDVNKYFDNVYSDLNKTAGFTTNVDFSKLSLGLHQIAIRVFDENNNKSGEIVIYVFLSPSAKFNVNTIDATKYPGYKEKISQLVKNHPEWNFKLLYTGITLDEAVKGEHAVHSRNLVPPDYSGEWICEVCGTKLYDSGWYCASEKAIEYYLDPRNFLDDVNIFQFLDLNEYSADSVSIQGIQSKVKNTFLANYANDVNNACKNTKVNPYYIIARLLQEQGTKGTKIGTGMDGGDGKTYYNPFNIGASGNGYNEIYKNALEMAKSKGWDSMQKAIEGGISFCKKNWLDNYQNTLYQNKFDIDSTNGTSLYTHQYMQNLMGAFSEAQTLRSMYANIGKIDSSLTFVIPLYEKMEKTLPTLPKNNSESRPINVKVVSNGNLNLRQEANSDSKILKSIPQGEVLLSIQRGINSDWHKIILEDGTIGFMSGKYLKQVADVTNCKYSAYVKTSSGGGCNVRVGPSTNVGKITLLPDGTKVTVINEGTYNNIVGYNWVRILLSDGRQAFIPSEYLTK